MEEVWKDVKGFEGLYQVSNTGFVKSLKRGKNHYWDDFYILKPTILNSGYDSVTLYNGPKHREKWLVHRLVAKHFIPNPNGWPQINHIDENKQNNSVDNLEWCTAKYNNDYGTARLRRLETEQRKGKPVAQCLPNGTVIAKYRSAITAALLLGKKLRLITSCCNGYCTSAEGYCWKYIDEDEYGI